MNGGPRVVLLGWGNATPSQLVVYQRLYKTFGLEATSHIPNTLAGLAREGAYARSLAPLAADLASEKGARPIVVHFFSDNGFLGWAALLDALAATEDGQRAVEAIRGVIVDSAPGLWAVTGPVDFARRFALGMTPAFARVAKLGVRERVSVVTPLLGLAFLGYQVFFPGCVRMMLSAADRITASQPRCPHLFMYGEEDVLVPPSDVRKWIARQRGHGIEAEDQPFPDARHVALFPKDPRRYKSTIATFVKRVL